MSLPKYGEDGKIEISQKQTLSPKPDEEVIISEKTGLPEIRKKLQEPTAVPQAEPKQQPTTPKPKKQEGERVAYFSRELMHKDAERVRREYSQARKLQQQEDMEMENQETQEPEIIIPELDEIDRWARGVVQDLSEDTENAKNNQRLMIMATSVIKMCQLLQNYSVTMKSKMEKIAERELQNLNLQEQYAKSLKASTVEVTRGIYHQFKDEQEETFRDVQKYLYDSCDDMERKINACTAEVKKTTVLAVKAAGNVSATTRKLRRVKTFGDLMYYAAPLFVVIDIILRVIALVAHTP